MSDEPDRRIRRVAALVAIAVAAAASFATSPYVPTAHLSEQGSAMADVTGERPTVEGRVTVTLSSSVLPVAGDAARASGTLTIRPEASAKASGRAAARMTLLPLDGSPALAASGSQAYGELVQLCEPGRACTLSYEVRIELEDGEPIGETRLGWSASVSVSYTGRDVVPVGATITIEGEDTLTADAAPAGLDATTGEQLVVLDVDHPTVVHEVDLTLSADAVPIAPTGDASSAATLTHRWLDRPERGGGQQPYSLFVVPEETLDDPPTSLPRTVGQEFEIFATCRAGQACTRRVLVVFAWTGRTPDDVARASWDLTARVRYPGVASLGAGAALTATIAAVRTAGPPAASVSARADDSAAVEIGAFEVSRADRMIRLTVDAATLDAADLRGVPPPAIVLLTATARRADGGDGQGGVVTVTTTWQTSPVPYGLGGEAVIGGAPAVIAVVPLLGCEAGQPCQVEGQVAVGAPRDEGPLPSGTGIVVDLRVEATVHYLGLSEPPRGASIDIDIEPVVRR